jgi:hypothetical protein
MMTLHTTIKLAALVLLAPVGMFSVFTNLGWVHVRETTAERAITICAVIGIALLILLL